MGRTFKRIGILTSGGDCPGLNAVIRAVVKTATNEYGWEVIGIEDGFEGLVRQGKTRPLTVDDVRGLLPRGGTILGTTNRGNPFAYKVLEGGEVKTYDLSQRVLDTIARLQLDALIIIGGDGSLKLALQFCQLGVPIVGIPKTIDNDLSETDVTFGFDTALITATEALDKLHTTAESHHRVMVLEVMGREAGWIALEAGLAGGADVILIPEIPFDYDRVCAKIEQRSSYGRRFSIVVVAEGAKPIGGKQVRQEAIDPRVEPRLGGIGDVVRQEISHRCGLESRVTVLGHLQRGGSPSPFDRILATRFGTAAVRLVAEDGFGKMVALRTPDIVAVPIEDAVRVQKLVPPDGDLIRTAKAMGIVFG